MVRRYYQQLEAGVLDPSRVATSVWDTITSLLGRSRAALSAPVVGTPTAAPMYRADMLFDLSTAPALAHAAEPASPDEVDALFLGDPSE